MKNAKTQLSAFLMSACAAEAPAVEEGKQYIDALSRRGLQDENVAVQLAFDRLNHPVPQRLQAELYDKVNYLCRKYMDRVARFYLCYDFVPDVRALETAILCLYEKVPIFHSLFISHPIRPYWKVVDYTLQDVLTVQKADCLQAAAIAFLEQPVAIDDPSQMKIALIHDEKQSILVFRWNHMIMDGGGFKQFTTDLCNAYNHYRQTGNAPLFFKTGTRSYDAVYADLLAEKKRKAKMQLAGVTAHEKKTLPFTLKSADDATHIVYHSIDADVMRAAFAMAKANNATINDLLSAAYIYASYKSIGCEQEPLYLSCAVDLRRYIKNPDRMGYTNHTTFMYCSVPQLTDTPLDLLKAVSQSNKKNKQDPFLGLHGIPLLHFAYSSMVHIQAESVVGLFYNNANIALSNVGPVPCEKYSLDGHAVTDALVAGGAKEKPCAAATVLTANEKLTISVCTKGNQQDIKMLQDFFRYFEQYVRSITPN